MPSHIKRTIRNLWRNKLYSALNLSGLAIGMAAAMLIGLWVQNELRFDGYHRCAENIHRIKTDLKISDTETWHWGSTPLKINELCNQTPGVTAIAQMYPPEGVKAIVRRGADFFEEKNYAYVSPGWFEMFDYEFVEGSANGFGERPNDAVLSESLARKIFGDRSAIGATLRLDSTDFVVHGVVRDPRPESSFRENLMLPTEAWLRHGGNRKNDESWSNFNYNTFVELRPDASPETVAGQLTSLLTAAKQDSGIVLKLGKLTDLHFDQSIKGDVFEKGNRRSVAAFAAIGLLILLLAAINYVSLTTARAQTRAREAGIRKMVGAGRSHLFGQFLGESFVLATGAGVLAFLLVKLALPAFSDLAERAFYLPLDGVLPYVLVGGTLLATVVLAGIYPALLMAGFQPMDVLRGSKNGNSGRGKSNFRQGLVVAQFTISVALLISTIVIGQQRAYIQNKEMGYEREQIFGFSIGWQLQRQLGEERSETMQNALEQSLRQSAAVADLCRANSSPVHINSSHSGSVHFDGQAPDSKPTVSQLSADENFASFFGLKLKEGRWFEPNNASDKSNVVLNETAARKLGIREPWVGQRFEFHGEKGQIVGIVEDFHFLPLHEAITPLVVFNSSNWRGNFFVKTRPGQTAQAVAAAENIWKNWFPGRPFEYDFLDDEFNKMYRAEQRAGLLFNLFAGIAIFIACLGLFGLATFVAAQRTKEIGIRKVLGATVASISNLLVRDFVKLVVLAIVIASPIAYFFMQKWLSDFAYRIEIEWWMFAGAGLSAVAVACLTVGFQAVRAALANPVKSLRNE